MRNDILSVGAFPPKNDYLWVTWSILLACNYSCRYCQVKDKGFASRETIDKTISFLQNAPQKIKDVTLFGGEPSIHPNVLYTIEKLKTFCRNVYIFTNLSSSTEDIQKLINTKVKFSLSYHSDVIPAQDFLEKLSYLYDNGGDIDFINVMMVYGKEEENEKVCSYCRERNIKHRLLPVYTEGGKVNWVQSVIYSRRPDVNAIRNTIVAKENKTLVLSEQECISLNMVNFLGFRCFAGVRSLFIDHKGNVFRCQGDMNTGIKFCTVDDVYPRLEAYICPHKECTCEYYIPKEIKEGLADKLLEGVE